MSYTHGIKPLGIMKEKGRLAVFFEVFDLGNPV